MEGCVSLTINENEKICPLCGEENGCQSGEPSCWCYNIEIPDYVLDMVPKDNRGKACICKKCIEQYTKP